MATATLTFGRTSITKEFTGAVTVGEVATKTNLTFLGAPSDSVSFVVDGNAVDAATLLQDGDEVYVEQKAHSKAGEITVTLTYGRNSITKTLQDGDLVKDITTKTNLTFLGAPADSVKFVVDGNETAASEELEDGMEIYVEQKAHSKAADEISVTLTYGRNSITKILSEYATVGDLTTKTNLTFLGAPADSVKFVIDGEEVNSATTIEDGDEIYVEQKAHSKAK